MGARRYWCPEDSLFEFITNWMGQDHFSLASARIQRVLIYKTQKELYKRHIPAMRSMCAWTELFCEIILKQKQYHQPLCGMIL